MSTIDRHKLDRPCPTWCELPNGHTWEGADATSVWRIHGHSIGGGEGWSVHISVDEQAAAIIPRDDDGDWSVEDVIAEASTWPGHILVDVEVNEPLAADEARQMALALMDASDKIHALGHRVDLNDQARQVTPGPAVVAAAATYPRGQMTLVEADVDEGVYDDYRCVMVVPRTMSDQEQASLVLELMRERR